MSFQSSVRKFKKVAVTGPESTGKSTLANSLAGFFSEPFVDEYAREYLNGLDRKYEESDLLNIAKGQVALEKAVRKEPENFLFLDTELINIKIWSLHKFGRCDEFILNNIAKQKIELYLLCDIDIPWEYDPLRENPDQREYFFNWFIKELEDYGFNYKVISGNHEERLKSAVDAVKMLV